MIIRKTGLDQLSFGIRQKKVLAQCPPYQLNVKLLTFFSGRLHFTISHWDQRHLQFLVICVKDGTWDDFQWNSDSWQTWGFGKILSRWYLFSTFWKLLSAVPLLRLSRIITCHFSNSPFLYPTIFGLNIEVSNLSTYSSSNCLNLILQRKVF